ncbi:hypothetical protein OsI_19511 [Oryza sativa Indica Group]|uniref:Uncharacterized protein n=1 Tax=Oryza sativa subsp. indica TaxID=39946 RepID=B8AWP8_ORYSI|nr:hypothetical protein OsI_19511 [Oryza sativa Indica Group]
MTPAPLPPQPPFRRAILGHASTGQAALPRRPQATAPSPLGHCTAEPPPQAVTPRFPHLGEPNPDVGGPGASSETLDPPLVHAALPSPPPAAEVDVVVFAPSSSRRGGCHRS